MGKIAGGPGKAGAGEGHNFCSFGGFEAMWR
ncbi:hypothetical protein QE417_000311 [Mucilaginibacter terrae]|uniref:Uncharacterized protein n=1 Tax=Mucilaginibacter terrae TaxID=1955052 RepID=A0ABU3GN72_9SPHI|nr:hypothetical protein [Mucilaginibacter terrae]